MEQRREREREKFGSNSADKAYISTQKSTSLRHVTPTNPVVPPTESSKFIRMMAGNSKSLLPSTEKLLCSSGVEFGRFCHDVEAMRQVVMSRTKPERHADKRKYQYITNPSSGR